MMGNDDKIYKVGKSVFYLPEAETDCIQRSMLGGSYWDMHAHRLIDKYIKRHAVILDIGANIGSHTIYWAMEREASKVYAFDPFNRVFDVLARNIELNSLQDRVFAFNVGLSDEETHAKSGNIFSGNLGSTQFFKEENGDFILKTLDSFNITDPIDLIKIDVEGHEVEVLKGGLNTITKNKPVLVIESFHRKAEVDAVLFPLGYIHIETIRKGEDYIYIHKG